MWKRTCNRINRRVIKINISEGLRDYKKVELEIEKRVNEFKSIWLSQDKLSIYKEFIFCLLTPQSRAKLCWESVLNLERKNFIFKGSFEDILGEISKGVRFREQKAKYILLNREKFLKDGGFILVDILKKIDNPHVARDYLVKNVLGYGLKEASHFLRNIGFSFDLAILDRHILKNLKREGVIEEIPKSLTKRKYLEIEKKFKEYSKKVSIPLVNLDLYFWWRETREIFK
ncbi:MAG: N-glycosylase/DNA lyase [Candidatus Hydrothermales bacterium]